MKTRFTIFLLLLVTISFAQQSQTLWKSEFDFGDGYIMTTFLKVDKTNNRFTMTSPKNADVRILGSLKARLGRLFKKIPKKGILITINGDQKGDSLIGVARIPMLGKLNFKGILKENLINGVFIKNDTIRVGNLKSIKTKKNSISYGFLYPKILKITQNNIYSKKVFQTKEWKKFQKKLKNLCNNAQDDIELFMGFNTLSSKLPFTHYNLIIQQDIEKESNAKEIEEKEPTESTVYFEEKNTNTAYLQIKNFGSSQKELSIILPKIVEKNYQNLIVDLRNNGGGGISAAFEFAKYIVKSSTEVGYFITNKLQYSRFQPELFKTLPEVKPKTTEEFIAILKAGKGAKLIFPQSEKLVFSGNLYILTNSKTASTCEPIVYMLKTSKRATIIGETTAGAMLSATLFDISGKYKLYLPIADFYTYDGVRLDQVGIKPNIETKSDNALDKALSLINDQNNK